MSRVQRLVDLLAAEGPLSSATVQKSLDISRPTLSRLMREVGDDILRLGQTRRVRYALARRLEGLPETLPVARVDEDGRAQTHARIRPLQPTEWAWDEDAQPLRIGTGLPREIADLWPAGYMGGNPTTSEVERIRWLAESGEDLPGNLIVGEQALARFLSLDPPNRSLDALPVLARNAEEGRFEAGRVSGDSPKFTAWMENHQVLVKFAPLSGDRADERRADLLVAEGAALEQLRQMGSDVPPVRLIDRDGWRFLALARFDRVGRLGRRAVIRLSALSGRGVDSDDWLASATALRRSLRLSEDDARDILRRHAFGRFIGNDDLGGDNLAFFPGEEEQLTLAPIYDMLPSSLMPAAGGELPEQLPELPLPMAGELALWKQTGTAAATYWQRLANDDRLSFDFRKLAGAQGKRIADRLERVGG